MAPPPPPPDAQVVIDALEASPNPGTVGGVTTLSWRTRNATKVRVLSGSAELFSSEQMTAVGSYEAELPNLTNNFTLEASAGEQLISQTVVVRAEPSGPRDPRIISFAASPLQVSMPPQSVTLVWRVADATEVSLSQDGAPVTGFPGGLDGNHSVEVSRTTTFTLSAMGNGMTVTESVEVTVFGTEVEPNNTPQTATPIMDTHDANLSPEGDIDYFSVEVPEGGNIIAFTTDLMGDCTVDTVLRLLGPDGATELGLNDDVNTGAGLYCSLISAEDDAFARSLPAGTYYLEVTGYTDDMGSFTGPYVLNVEVRGPGCGNAIPELGEQCDDGGVAPGDGCDASCQAELSGALSGPELDQTLSGALAAGAASYTQLTVTSTAYLRVETFAPAAPGCAGENNDTVVFLLDETFSQITANDDGGAELCSRLDPDLDADALVPPGTYYLMITPYGSTTVPAYEVRVELLAPRCGNGVNEPAETCDDGNAADGDGCSAGCALEPQATIEPPGGSATINLTRAADVRSVAINITQPGQTITATLGDGMMCGPFPAIELYDPALSPLGVDFPDLVDEECAALIPGFHDFASNLAVGAHQLALANLGGAPGPVSLQVGVVNPACGNGILESRAGEACEDSNTQAGDGCDGSCQFEQKGFVRETEPNNDVMSANVTGVTAQLPLTFAGTIDPIGDQDYFRLEVPAGQTATVFARTYGSLADDTACHGDSSLELLDGAGVVLAQNDDDPVNQSLCSRISVESVSMAASDLPEGTYYLRVFGFVDQSVVRVYYLDIELR